MDIYQPNRQQRKSRARERIAARQRRTPEPMVTPTRTAPETGMPLDRRAGLQRHNVTMPNFGVQAPKLDPSMLAGARQQLGVAGRDLLWYVRQDKRIPIIIGSIVALAAVVWMVLHVAQGRIFPNVWSLGVPLGDMTVDEATVALQTAWANDVQIRLVDGDREWTTTPAQLGLRLDARTIAEGARSVGMAGMPFGYGITPTLTMDELTAQTALLDLSMQTNVEPFNAGYRWEGDQIIGMPGTDGRFLDVALSLTALQDELPLVAELGRFDLVMTPVTPDIHDPSPYLAQAQALTQQTFILRGYDPFINETLAWTADRDTLTSWLEAGEETLSLREEPFADYLDAQQPSVMVADERRYLEPSEAIERVRNAIEAGQASVELRIRYRASLHTVEVGDSGYGIARQVGVPFRMVEELNPNRDWTELYAGDVVNVPSPDLVLPLPPVSSKRIVVDLDSQQLWGFENGQLVFNWMISSGMERAPTSPGIYQILSHAELATGSSNELCSGSFCGTWDMNWFMGIYEVSPGLVNGFHGAVLLPNQTYMGDGTVGRPFTYGCVMSTDPDAYQLYMWADEGTMVEIVSSEYDPRSDLARLALQMRDGLAPVTLVPPTISA